MSESCPSLGEVALRERIRIVREAAAKEGVSPLAFAKKALLEETGEVAINALQDVVAFLEKELTRPAP
jgi:hypothetical protein